MRLYAPCLAAPRATPFNQDLDRNIGKSNSHSGNFPSGLLDGRPLGKKCASLILAKWLVMNDHSSHCDLCYLNLTGWRNSRMQIWKKKLRIHHFVNTNAERKMKAFESRFVCMLKGLALLSLATPMCSAQPLLMNGCPHFYAIAAAGGLLPNMVCCRDQHIAAWTVKPHVASSPVEHWKFSG